MTLVIDKNIFSVVNPNYDVKLEVNNAIKPLPTWMSYISSEMKLLMFPPVSELG